MTMTEAWRSPLTVATDVREAGWDAFLESTPLGHFQQSSLWARVKQADGWCAVRRVVTRGDRIAGGFQMLEGRTRWGRVGYVYKGPVMSAADAELAEQVGDLLVDAVRSRDLRAVIVQPPDADIHGRTYWTGHGFLPNGIVRTVSATLVVDLTGGPEQVWRKIRRSTRKEIRQAQRRGVDVVQGGEGDLDRFFALMLETCRRQKTTPAPARAQALKEVWEAFHPSGKAKLFLARCEGETVAGMLCLGFGRRMVGWKKGWSGRHGERNPNQVVAYEAIRWAAEHGYDVFDCVAVDRRIAETLLRNAPLTDEQKRSRHYFNLAFGGRPVRFPPAHVYVPNPWLRSCYRTLMNFRMKGDGPWTL